MSLAEYLQLLGLNVLVCRGFYAATRPASILIRPRLFLEDYLPTYLTAPLWGCLTCMASLHSLYVFWPLHDFSAANLARWCVYVLALAGANEISRNL